MSTKHPINIDTNYPYDLMARSDRLCKTNSPFLDCYHSLISNLELLSIPSQSFETVSPPWRCALIW